jgi:glyoxylase-like metal-dependent hydrolase (beta-lactamase superfamily II)
VLESQLNVGCVVSAPFDENSYIAHLSGRADCIIFDPGFEPAAIFEYIDGHGLTPAAILCTHGHSDHIAGNAAMKRRWPQCPLVIGAGDAAKLTNPELNLSAAFGVALLSPPADQTLVEGERFAAAGIELEVYETPAIRSAISCLFASKRSHGKFSVAMFCFGAASDAPIFRTEISIH